MLLGLSNSTLVLDQQSIRDIIPIPGHRLLDHLLIRATRMYLQIKNHTMLNEFQELCLPTRAVLLLLQWPSGVNDTQLKQ
jgi:hypothetical protein